MLWIELFSGLALLVAGGEALVRGASSLAARLGVSPLLIGLTVVGFGTSTPELVTSLQAAFAGSPGIAVGNVIGSNIANALLILGIAAILMPFAVERRAFLRDGTALLAATLAAVAIGLWGELSRPAGAVLLAGLVLYLAMAYRSERIVDPGTMADEGATPALPAAPQTPATRLPLALMWAVGGIALTVMGARLLVGASIDLAGLWGVPDAVIGLTIVAVGTSLPELVTSVVAALRRQGAIAFGNVVGSNLYNILGILGITALVKPIPVPPQIAVMDIWVMLGATVALVAVAVTGWRVSRGEGMALLAAYAAYVAWLAMGV
ncbi:calcium/sodium antiporter [uncultured Jannaschia sp.]|uniref:calcium/sodium antiporter n=1 Tax=uncultured Jannaschia sp. TaxID=293347 RepID=UPI002627A44F|nr:calcium/sodium antiporter [uncultured Jannaschia sp.]